MMILHHTNVHHHINLPHRNFFVTNNHMDNVHWTCGTNHHQHNFPGVSEDLQEFDTRPGKINCSMFYGRNMEIWEQYIQKTR